MEGFEVQSALGMGDTPWVKGRPIPGQDATQIEQLVLNGDILEVFAQTTNGAPSGIHIRLPPPLIQFVMEVGPQQLWREAMREMDGRVFDVVIDASAKEWRLNHKVPGVDDVTIVKIISDTMGTVTVFGTPAPGSPWGRSNAGFIFTLMPMTGHFAINERMPMDKWIQLREEIELEADGNDEDDPDETEDEVGDAEEDAPPSGPAPVQVKPEPPAGNVSFMPAPPPPPPVAANGPAAPSTTTDNPGT